MKKFLAVLLVILFLGLVGSGIYFLGKKKGWFGKAPDQAPEEKNNRPTPPNGNTGFMNQSDSNSQPSFTQDDIKLPPSDNRVFIDKNKTLKKGSTGPEVILLQKYLEVDADGKFGNQTEGALFTKIGSKSTSLLALVNWVSQKYGSTSANALVSSISKSYKW